MVTFSIDPSGRISTANTVNLRSIDSFRLNVTERYSPPLRDGEFTVRSAGGVTVAVGATVGSTGGAYVGVAVGGTGGTYGTVGVGVGVGAYGGVEVGVRVGP